MAIFDSCSVSRKQFVYVPASSSGSSEAVRLLRGRRPYGSKAGNRLQLRTLEYMLPALHSFNKQTTRNVFPERHEY